MKHVGRWRVRIAGSLHYRTKSKVWPSLVTSDWNSRLIPVASDLPVHPILLKSDFLHSISYLAKNTLIPMKCIELRDFFQREFWEKNLREKQDWFIHNLIHLILQIPLLSPFSLLKPWEDYRPNPYLTRFWVVRRFLEFGKQFKREPIHIGWCNGLIAGSGKLEKTWFGVTLLE